MLKRDIYNVLNHDIDVLIELIGGISDAKKLISAAMEKGIHVVTANKAVIFSHGDELQDLLQQIKKFIYYLRHRSVLEHQLLIYLRIIFLEIKSHQLKEC